MNSLMAFLLVMGCVGWREKQAEYKCLFLSLRVHFLELHAFSSSQPGSSFPPEPSPGASLSQEIKICVPGGPKWRGLLRSDERQKQRENSGKEVANGASALRAIWGGEGMV